MYNSSPLWERSYFARKSRRFWNHYSDSNLFKITSPLSSVFWIFSSIFSSYSTPLAITAVGTLILPAFYYYYMFRPFNIEIDWKQLTPQNSTTERANYRGRINVGEDKARIRITALFDTHVNAYSLQLESDNGVDIYPTSGSLPSVADYDEDTKTISADGVDNAKFFFTLVVEADEDMAIHDPAVRIKDTHKYSQGLLEILPDRVLDLFRRHPVIMRFTLH
ncbi:hypothetical protein [Halorubrum sp. PV6]|uniref:hypothetical protein n=1 Tax=Halorubrum sp. PV6 TaxID=634157 RepID=UPI000F8E5A27|nr:hypothetical protein [Halorubrum sp. PV6]